MPIPESTRYKSLPSDGALYIKCCPILARDLYHTGGWDRNAIVLCLKGRVAPPLTCVTFDQYGTIAAQRLVAEDGVEPSTL